MRRVWPWLAVVVAAGCGGSADHSGPGLPSGALSADGIGIVLPDGWTGRILIGASGRAVLHAASFPVESNDTDEGEIAREAMGVNGMYLNLRDLGPGDAASSLPIRFDAPDFQPARFDREAAVDVTSAGERFRVTAVSGGEAPPAPLDLEQLNRALATVELAPYRPEPAAPATGHPIGGFGLHANVPAGWEGGIARGEVHAGDGSVDLGITECSCPDAASFVTGRQPLTIGSDELVHPPNGTGYETGRSFSAGGRAFQLWVRTPDEHPSTSELARVNAFLASFRAEPGDFYPGRVEPATFAPAEGWDTGSSGPADIQPEGQSTMTWASTVPYRDAGFQWPPHETLAALPPDGVVLTVQLEQHGAELQPPAPLSLADFHEGAFEGLGAENAPRYLRAGSGNADVTVWALFGREDPTGEQLARAQAELDRLKLPDWPAWTTSAER